MSQLEVKAAGLRAQFHNSEVQKKHQSQDLIFPFKTKNEAFLVPRFYLVTGRNVYS